jgi:hypothetical protein
MAAPRRWRRPRAIGLRCRSGRLRRRLTPPGAQETATGDCHASLHAGMATADPSPNGGSLSLPTAVCPRRFYPMTHGGSNRPVGVGRRVADAPVSCGVPSRPRRGGRGKRERGFAGAGPLPLVALVNTRISAYPANRIAGGPPLPYATASPAAAASCPPRSDTTNLRKCC